ncbi:MAG: transcriptional regulator, ArsR family [Parcubacteria group bacterium]|nr:transcriptional regulator, ArsR family [Parcubacteria group bacterium]
MSELCIEMARMGKGIGNENRFRILEALMKKPRTVGEVAKEVKLPQPAVSQHLKVLKSANLVEDDRQGQEVIYSVNVSYMASLLKKLAVGLPENNKKNKPKKHTVKK